VSAFYFEKLNREHPIQNFDCGEVALNQFLIRRALNNQLAKASQTYLCVTAGLVVGYFTLVVGEIAFDDAPERLRKGLARHPVPVMVLARLAVDANKQGLGLGASLVKDAILRTLAASEIAGIRAIVVHAKNEAAFAFYSHFGFLAGFANPLHLYALTKDLKAMITA
jgi:predicted N-acetyltransferase YhbS